MARMANQTGKAAHNRQQQQKTDQAEGQNLPVPTESEAERQQRMSNERNRRDVTGVTDVNPEDVAKNVPYDDSGYSEAGMLDDKV